MFILYNKAKSLLFYLFSAYLALSVIGSFVFLLFLSGFKDGDLRMDAGHYIIVFSLWRFIAALLLLVLFIYCFYKSYRLNFPTFLLTLSVSSGIGLFILLDHIAIAWTSYPPLSSLGSGSRVELSDGIYNIFLWSFRSLVILAVVILCYGWLKQRNLDRRPLLTILSLLLTTITFSQSLSDKYLHYRTDYYWDTTLYKSEFNFYYEISKGNITEKEYPVLAYLYTRIQSEKPLITKDTFERKGWFQYPYKYIRKDYSIYLQYFDLGKRKLQVNKEYSLNPNDTVKGLATKSSLHSKNGISVSGFSTYLGEALIVIGGKQFSTFRFLEDHVKSGSYSIYYTREIFLEKKTLIPIRFITRHYHYNTRQPILYNSITELAYSGSVLQDYTNKTTQDLVLYENKSTNWTVRQKQIFFDMFGPDMNKYAECLLKKLDGHISFFHFEQNIRFKTLVVNKECE